MLSCTKGIIWRKRISPVKVMLVCGLPLVLWRASLMLGWRVLSNAARCREVRDLGETLGAGVKSSLARRCAGAVGGATGTSVRPGLPWGEEGGRFGRLVDDAGYRTGLVGTKVLGRDCPVNNRGGWGGRSRWTREAG